MCKRILRIYVPYPIEEMRERLEKDFEATVEQLKSEIKEILLDRIVTISNKSTTQLERIHFVELMMLKMAIFLDNQHEDNIRDIENPWSFDSNDGRIKPMDKDFWKKLKKQDKIVHPIFRTKEDAKLACSVLREEIKATYGKE